MVPRSVRWPLDPDLRIKAAAQARGIPMSQLIRELAEAGLAEMDDDQPISRAEVMRIIAGLPPWVNQPETIASSRLSWNLPT